MVSVTYRILKLNFQKQNKMVATRGMVDKGYKTEVRLKNMVTILMTDYWV